MASFAVGTIADVSLGYITYGGGVGSAVAEYAVPSTPKKKVIATVGGKQVYENGEVEHITVIEPIDPYVILAYPTIGTTSSSSMGTISGSYFDSTFYGSTKPTKIKPLSVKKLR